MFHLVPCKYRRLFLSDSLTPILATMAKPFQCVISGMVFATYFIVFMRCSDTCAVVPFCPPLHTLKMPHDNQCRIPYKLHIHSSQIPQQPYRQKALFTLTHTCKPTVSLKLIKCIPVSRFAPTECKNKVVLLILVSLFSLLCCSLL